MIGNQLGNYRVVARLGEGGMGTVYRATDTMLDRDVALKVLRPELAKQAALVERFRAEAVALARLRHEHIAALYGLEKHGDELVMIMEFVKGETLESRLTRTGPMPWQEAIPVMRGVLAALGHAHVRGVVHRDIKPANVMVDADGTVKVMDFGIARLMGENRQTRAGVAVGTPSYMAPEQLRGEDVDGRTDLYAAGALLFELLTGRVAFEAESDYSLMMQQLNEPPRQPSAITPGVPRALDAAVAKAMAKKPTQRFGTATDFSRVLDEISADTFSVEPIRDAAAAVAAKAPRDWRVYAIAGCVVAAALLGVAALRSKPAPADDVFVTADTGRTIAEQAGAGGPAPDASVRTQAATDPVATVAAGFGGSAPISPPESPETAPAPTPVVSTPVSPAPVSPAPVSPTRRAPSQPVPRSTSPTPTRITPAPAPVRTQVAAEPPAPVTNSTREAEPARQNDAPSRGGGARRVQDLAERCTSAIADNNAGAASRLLSGDAGGLLSAISDGRIASASAGNVSVDEGDGRAEGSFSVRIAWRTAFGGNKSSTARLAAAASYSDGGWAALRCRVESGGGVR